MNYFSFGKGEKRLIILPGASVKSALLSAAAVAEAYNCFAEDYTVYLFDYPDKLQKGCTIADIASDIAEAIGQLGIEQADFFGCSLGGMVAQYIAINNPELVRKMVLGSTLSRNNGESSAVFSKWCRLADSGDAAALNRDVFSRVYSAAYYEQYKDVFAFMETSGTPEELARFSVIVDACCRMDSFEALDKISCPVLVIGSWEDKTVPPECCVELAEKLGCELFMYSGYSHAVYDEAPDYKARIMNFFAAT